jgi:hypothetical protein
MSEETRNDSAFYTYSPDSEIAWKDFKNECIYFVARVGEMRIHATDKQGIRWVIRYTDDLEEFGITNDRELAEWSMKGEDVFSWVNNSWFEVFSHNDPDFSEENSIHDLAEAINHAKKLDKKERKVNV